MSSRTRSPWPPCDRRRPRPGRCRAGRSPERRRRDPRLPSRRGERRLVPSAPSGPVRQSRARPVRAQARASSTRCHRQPEPVPADGRRDGPRRPDIDRTAGARPSDRAATERLARVRGAVPARGIGERGRRRRSPTGGRPAARGAGRRDPRREDSKRPVGQTGGACKKERSRRRPIFPGGCPPSIFGAGELNFRVRDGNGWTLSASVTGTNLQLRAPSVTGWLEAWKQRSSSRWRMLSADSERDPAAC
jgi:hypothetical protein